MTKSYTKNNEQHLKSSWFQQLRHQIHLQSAHKINCDLVANKDVDLVVETLPCWSDSVEINVLKYKFQYWL